MKFFMKSACLAAALALIGGSAQAGFRIQDGKIKIDQAVNSPTLTVRYTKVKGAIIELRIDGRSRSTRMITGSDTGETNFTIDLDRLEDGEHEVEIVILDDNGKVIATEKSSLKVDRGVDGPVYMMGVKDGASVQGPVELKLGVSREFRELYVSFFIDDEWKSLKNFPPYTYLWDSTKVQNGWHEVQAWVVDEFNNTMKTRKVKIFVNNPGGRTDRRTEEPTLDSGKPKTTVNGTGSGMKPTVVSGQPVNNTKPKEPNAVSAVATPVMNRTMAPAAGMKELPTVSSVVMGPRILTPTGKRRVVKAAPPVKTAAPVKNTLPAVVKTTTNVVKATTPAVKATAPIKATTTKLPTVPIKPGTALQGVHTFAIILNSKIVNFDVAPMVVSGVPIAPFRHLFEETGGKVTWDNLAKIVGAKGAGKSISFKIGDKNAKVNSKTMKMEVAPRIVKDRALVPLSFVKGALDVEVEYDPNSGHVLITADETAPKKTNSK